MPIVPGTRRLLPAALVAVALPMLLPAMAAPSPRAVVQLPPLPTTTTSPTTTRPPASPPSASPPSGPTLYRPVGCRARPGVYRQDPSRSRRKVVALTFDDGPAAITPKFVSMLAAEHVPATFFMIGQEVVRGEDPVLRSELRAGDALGDHTETHPDLAAVGDVAAQLSQARTAIADAAGYTPCIFRPPYGAYDAHVLQVARSLGLATIMWSVDPSDWAEPGVSAIEQRVLSAVVPGDIVLSHDGGGPRTQTLAAYPDIIAALRARGYRFETVPELLGFPTIYRRCATLCDDAAVARSDLPPGSIIEPG